MFDKMLTGLNGLSVYILPAGVCLVTVIVGYIARSVIFRRFLHWASKTKTDIDDIIIISTRTPFLVWCLMLGIYFGLEVSHIPKEWVRICGKALFVLGSLSVMMVLSNISARFIAARSARFESALPVTSLTQNISRIVIFGIGLLLILNTLGIAITPILATLGVGGLAVALALQDSLSNLFAGFHIVASRQIKIGDYVKLESGEEGYVSDITWRSTKIRMLANNVILVPNAKLTQVIATNYYLPEKEMAVLVDLRVHYGSDLKKVERVTCEVAKEVMKEVTGGVEGFEPFIRYHTFGDFSINFSVIMRAREFVDQYLIKHEFVKRLHERYNKEGIVIPYPIRAINNEQERTR